MSMNYLQYIQRDPGICGGAIKGAGLDLLINNRHHIFIFL
jgi:hypothetical protein